ncbi:MAG: RICIN domain-containing protein [Kibdelosporangium sp.]
MAAVLAAVVALGPAAQADPRILAYENVQNWNSKQCLLVRGEQNNNPAVQFPCGHWADQLWQVEQVNFQAPYHYRLRSLNSQRCLAVRGSANNTQAVQFDCDSRFADQHWYPIGVANGYLLQNRNSGKCLVARGQAADSPVVQFDCDERFADQKWVL